MFGRERKRAMEAAVFLRQFGAQRDLLLHMGFIPTFPSQGIRLTQDAEQFDGKHGTQLPVGRNGQQLPLSIRIIDCMGREAVITDQIADSFPELS